MPFAADFTRKLKNYNPTKFKAKDSYYDKEYADFSVAFIESLCRTKGTWAGERLELWVGRSRLSVTCFLVLGSLSLLALTCA